MDRRSQGPIPAETLIGLRKRLQSLPPRSAARREAVESTARLFDVSASTVYRALQALHRPKSLRRADHGRARAMSEEDLNRYCEIVAALKLRTSNRKGRRLSTNGPSSCSRITASKHPTDWFGRRRACSSGRR